MERGDMDGQKGTWTCAQVHGWTCTWITGGCMDGGVLGQVDGHMDGCVGAGMGALVHSWTCAQVNGGRGTWMCVRRGKMDMRVDDGCVHRWTDTRTYPQMHGRNGRSHREHWLVPHARTTVLLSFRQPFPLPGEPFMSPLPPFTFFRTQCERYCLRETVSECSSQLGSLTAFFTGFISFSNHPFLCLTGSLPHEMVQSRAGASFIVSKCSVLIGVPAA